MVMYILGKHSSSPNPERIRQVDILLILIMLEFIRCAVKGVVNGVKSR